MASSAKINMLGTLGKFGRYTPTPLFPALAHAVIATGTNHSLYV